MRHTRIATFGIASAALAASKDAGAAASTTTAAAPAAKADAPIKLITINGDLPVPPRNKPRGPGSKFPFDTLEVGKFFALAERDAKSLQTIIGNQNRKHMQDAKDANGSIVYETETVTDAAGNVTQVHKTPLKAKRVATKRFYAVDVDPAAYQGASVLVVREA
jgi:hypothetical protein